MFTRTAKFKSIALIPDTTTMTYSVTIELEASNQTIIGDLAEVRLELSRIFWHLVTNFIYSK